MQGRPAAALRGLRTSRAGRRHGTRSRRSRGPAFPTSPPTPSRLSRNCRWSWRTRTGAGWRPTGPRTCIRRAFVPAVALVRADAPRASMLLFAQRAGPRQPGSACEDDGRPRRGCSMEQASGARAKARNTSLTRAAVRRQHCKHQLPLSPRELA